MEDDYGVETLDDSKPKDASQLKPNDAAKKADVIDEDNIYQEESFNANKPKKAEADGPQQASKKQEEAKNDQIVDDEDPYGDGGEVFAGSGDLIKQKEKELDRIEDGEKAFVPSDVMFVFMGTDFLFLDFQKDTWNMGDVQQVEGFSQFFVPQNSGIVKVDQDKQACTHSNLFITGGVSAAGDLMTSAIGIKFEMKTGDNEFDTAFQLNLVYSDPSFVMPIQRMMHESCFVKNSKNQPRLLVIGGKIGKNLSTCAYTDSVLAYDMLFVFQPWLESKVEGGSQQTWQTCKQMNNRRANFCHIVLDNYVYVFGGISGAISEKKGKGKNLPKMPTINAERYDPVADLWEKYEIENIPSLGAFAWTQIGSDSSEVVILGGTDGDLIQETMWVIDFKNKTAKPSPFEFEQNIAMNKLIYRKKGNMLYSFGGYGSSGQNFKLKYQDGEEWQELERSHLALITSGMGGANSNDIELVHYPNTFFS